MFLKTCSCCLAHSCIPVCRWLQANYGIPPGCVTEGTLDLGHQHIKKGQDRFSRYARLSLNRPLSWFIIEILTSVVRCIAPNPIPPLAIQNDEQLGWVEYILLNYKHRSSYLPTNGETVYLSNFIKWNYLTYWKNHVQHCICFVVKRIHKFMNMKY